jgi:hypothetical protein
MQFSVPQFIEVEDKIIGPLTLRQFLYFLAAGGVVFLFYMFFTLPIMIILSVPIILFAIALAFYKPNGRPFQVLLFAMFRFFTRPRLYKWKRVPELAPKVIKSVTRKEEEKDRGKIKEVTESRLKQLAWVLDTAGGLEERQAVAKNIRKEE